MWLFGALFDSAQIVSMKSGLEGGKIGLDPLQAVEARESQCSPVWKTGTIGSPREAVLTRNFTSTCERSAPQTPTTTLC